MLVEEVDVSIVDSLSNFFPDLMRSSPLNHVQLRPSILRLRTRGCANEEVIFELALEAILLDMVGQRGGNLPIRV